jgi:chaperone required for assembly of F1-ATPase
MRDFLKQIETGERDPVTSARSSLRAELPKRFYKEVSTEQGPYGFQILLDGKPVRTPAGHGLALPSKEAAGLVAAEWSAVGERIDPGRMPLTRLANTAIDGVATDTQAVIEDILKYCASDLICYRAAGPEGLVEAQNRFWNPILDWLRDTLGAGFVMAEGIHHAAQPKAAMAAFGARLKLYDSPLAVTCLHTMTTLTGSAMLALATAEDRLTTEQAWIAAHVDEDWNIRLWGQDDEAAERRAHRWREMEAAARLLAALS